MRLIRTSKDKTIMSVETDETPDGLTVDRQKLMALLACMDGGTVTLSRYEMTPEIGRTGLDPMDTLLIGDKSGKGFILAPIE